jgi:hypothetical protein
MIRTDTTEPGYNHIGLYDTSSITQDILWYQLIRNCACNETNLMHYLFSVYSNAIPLHVLGLPVAHHQEVTKYICDNWYVLYVLDVCQRAWLEWFHYTDISRLTINVGGPGWNGFITRIYRDAQSTNQKKNHNSFTRRL